MTSKEQLNRKALSELMERETERFESEKAAARERLNQEKPFTILNFNDKPLRLEGILSKYTIPCWKDEYLPPNAQRFQESIFPNEPLNPAVKVIIDEGLIYGKTINAFCYDDSAIGLNSFTVQRAVCITPMEIAYAVAECFTPIFWAPKDSFPDYRRPSHKRNFFGILIAEGNFSLKNLSLDTMIRVPFRNKDGKLQVIDYPVEKYLWQMLNGIRSPDRQEKITSAINMIGGMDETLARSIAELDGKQDEQPS